jgi:hypothetical protein
VSVKVEIRKTEAIWAKVKPPCGAPVLVLGQGGLNVSAMQNFYERFLLYPGRRHITTVRNYNKPIFVFQIGGGHIARLNEETAYSGIKRDRQD